MTSALCVPSPHHLPRSTSSLPVWPERTPGRIFAHRPHAAARSLSPCCRRAFLLPLLFVLSEWGSLQPLPHLQPPAGLEVRSIAPHYRVANQKHTLHLLPSRSEVHSAGRKTRAGCLSLSLLWTSRAPCFSVVADPGYCRLFGLRPGLPPTKGQERLPPQCDYPKCLQTLPHVPYGTQSLPVQDHGHGDISAGP